MIAVYDQKEIIGENYIIMPVDNKIHHMSKAGDFIIGQFKDNQQAQYVLDQIALAIEREDKLYRMPSVEEVEKKIKTAYNPIKLRESLCPEPKEQEGKDNA